MPKTKLGQWAVMSAAISTALIIFSLIIALIIGGDANNIANIMANNLTLFIFNNVLNFALNLAGLASLILGGIAVIKDKDWIVIKFLAILYGLAIAAFLIGEFLFPH